ncbi:hypothetical protein B0H13DRAFT_1879122 [Mycena leptocephala]|nr:hypothetical protein B0H13DRAFT_1879122 [Mycena leptocephala]
MSSFQICSEWTDSQPVNFVFRFRACSSKCKAKIVFSSMHVPKEHDNLHWGKWLPREIYVQENGETTHLYSIRAKKDAELERQQAIAWTLATHNFCLLKRDRNADVESAPGLHSSRLVYFTRDCSFLTTHQNAFELETWHELYIAERELIFHKNLETLKGFALTENKKIQGVLRCPTIAPLFRAFNRDLTLITHTVWMQHRKRALVELKVLAEGVFPPGMVARRNVKIRCAHCPRLLRVWAMASHLADKHQDTDIDAMPATTPCPDCPGSKRMFTNRGLMDHRLNKTLMYRLHYIYVPAIGVYVLRLTFEVCERYLLLLGINGGLVRGKKKRPSVVRLLSGAVEEPSKGLPAQKRRAYCSSRLGPTSDGYGDGRNFSAGWERRHMPDSVKDACLTPDNANVHAERLCKFGKRKIIDDRVRTLPVRLSVVQTKASEDSDGRHRFGPEDEIEVGALLFHYGLQPNHDKSVVDPHTAMLSTCQTSFDAIQSAIVAEYSRANVVKGGSLGSSLNSDIHGEGPPVTPGGYSIPRIKPAPQDCKLAELYSIQACCKRRSRKRQNFYVVTDQFSRVQSSKARARVGLDGQNPISWREHQLEVNSPFPDVELRPLTTFENSRRPKSGSGAEPAQPALVVIIQIKREVLTLQRSRDQLLQSSSTSL